MIILHDIPLTSDCILWANDTKCELQRNCLLMANKEHTTAGQQVRGPGQSHSTTPPNMPGSHAYAKSAFVDQGESSSGSLRMNTERGDSSCSWLWFCTSPLKNILLCLYYIMIQKAIRKQICNSFGQSLGKKTALHFIIKKKVDNF